MLMIKLLILHTVLFVVLVLHMLVSYELAQALIRYDVDKVISYLLAALYFLVVPCWFMYKWLHTPYYPRRNQ